MSSRALFFTVLALKCAILIAVVAIFGIGRLTWSDSALYLDLGRNIFAGNGFGTTLTDGSVSSTTRFMPLYPFVVGFFSRYLPYGLFFVSLIQAFMAAGIALMVYLIGRKFLSQRMALAAAVLVTFEPLISVMHFLILTETFFTFFLLLFIYYFFSYFDAQSYKNLFLAVLALAFALYTRPAAVYLFVIPVSFLIFSKGGYKRAIAFMLLLLLFMFPWMARNKAAAGSYDITSDDTGNICSWELTAVMATKYGVDSSDWSTTVNLPEYKDMIERCTSIPSVLKIFIFEYPKEFIVASSISTLSLLTNDGYSVFFEKPTSEQIKPHHNYLTPVVFIIKGWPGKITGALKEFNMLELFVILAGKLFWILATIFSIAGFLQLIVKNKSREALFLLLTVLYFISVTVISTGFGVGARLRYPIDPLIIIFAFYSLSLLIKRFNAKKIHAS